MSNVPMHRIKTCCLLLPRFPFSNNFIFLSASLLHVTHAQFCAVAKFCSATMFQEVKVENVTVEVV